LITFLNKIKARHGGSLLLYQPFGGRDWEDHGTRPAEAKITSSQQSEVMPVIQDKRECHIQGQPHAKITKTKMGGEHGSGDKIPT
jgi:hypothetical protein